LTLFQLNLGTVCWVSSKISEKKYIAKKAATEAAADANEAVANEGAAETSSTSK
jgi:hypothetical protein